MNSDGVIIIIICIVLLVFDDVVAEMGMVMERLLYYELSDVTLTRACYIKYFLCVFVLYLCICDCSVFILLQNQLPYGDK